MGRCQICDYCDTVGEQGLDEVTPRFASRHIQVRYHRDLDQDLCSVCAGATYSNVTFYENKAQEGELGTWKDIGAFNVSKNRFFDFKEIDDEELQTDALAVSEV